MKSIFYALLFMLLPAGLIHGQQRVFVPGNHETIHLFRVDLASCTSQVLDTLPIGVFTIAFTPDGRLWAINNDLTNSVLYQVDTATGQVALAGYFDSHDIYIDALTALNDSTLLFAGQNAADSLYALNVNSVHSYLVGRTGYACWGDLVWYRDELFMTGFPGNSPDSMFLLKITLNNNSYPPIANVSRVCRLPEVFSYTLGLATVILPGMDTAMVVFADSNAYTINPSDGSYQLLCNAIIPDSVYASGAACLLSYPSTPIMLDTINPHPNNIIGPSGSGLRVKLYPNPAGKALHVSYENDATATLMLTDIAGRILLSRQLIKGTQQISIASFAAGTYIAVIQTEDRTVYRQKILKE